MDTIALVMDDIELGRRATAALDAAKIDVRASLWRHVPDADEWRFVIATPLVDSIGPLRTYRTIRKALARNDGLLGQLPLRKIQALSPNDPLIRRMRRVVRTGRGISGVRFPSNVVDSAYLDDAYVYRLR